MRAAVTALLLAALALPATAQGRVVVVAADRARAELLDVSSNTITGRVALPGQARAVATAPDGSRAYVTAGHGVSAIDLGARAVTATARLGGAVTAVATSPDGARVYATRGRALEVIDAAAMRRLAAIRLPRRARALAVAPDGTRALVSFAGGRGGAVVDLAAQRVRRRLRIAGAGAIAFDAVTARGSRRPCARVGGARAASFPSTR